MTKFEVKVYWWLNDMGKRVYGHDTFTQEDSDFEADDAQTLMDTCSDSDSEQLEEQMPNFESTHGCSTNPENWGVRKVVVKELKS